MFTFYQNFNARREENELQREAEMTGHDRFCQQRPGAAATRRKRRTGAAANRRTQSAIEIECNNDAFASVRSVLLRKEKSASVEEEDPMTAQAATPDEEGKGYYQLTSKIDSLAKILFNRVYAVKGYKETSEGQRGSGSGPSGSSGSGVGCYGGPSNAARQQYRALDQRAQPAPPPTYHLLGEASTTTATPTSTSPAAAASGNTAESLELERRSRDRALSICNLYVEQNPRYDNLRQLNNVGSRVDKYWFKVRDQRVKTDRLMTLAPLTRNCPLEVGPQTRSVLNKLFLTLQHPYISPTFELDFIERERQEYVICFQPINQGSLKDLIYGVERNCWNEDWSRKYGSRGRGLDVHQIQQMGRQILMALHFLKERQFPVVTHLHSGNVIIQHGVARLTALENSLLGFTSRIHPIIAPQLQRSEDPLVPEAIDAICFGHMLFEMAAGYELCTFEPTPVNLFDVQKHPQVLECINYIFQRRTPESRYPTIPDLIVHDLFRNIDLREMRHAPVNVFRPDTSVPISQMLDRIKRPKTPIKRLSHMDSEDMISLSSPESERSEGGSLLAQIYKELSITSV